MKTRPLILLVVVVTVVGALVFGIWSWQRQAQRRATLASAVPAVPDLSAWPEALREHIGSCSQRVRQGPDRIAALGELSGLYHANGFYAEAATCYTALEQLQPDNPRWLHRHASILAGFGEVDTAVALWKRVTHLAPDYAPARLRLADALLKNNHLEDAAAAYRAVLERAADNPYAELGLARCDFEAGNWAAARKRLEPLVTRTNYQLGYDLIVTVYERMGDTASADRIRGQKIASGAYRDPPDPWLDELTDQCYDAFRLSLVAGFLASSGQTAKAIHRLEQAIACSPHNHVLHFQLAGVYLNSRNYSKAREEFERCTQLAPDFPDGWWQLSDLCMTLGDRPAAEQALAKGLQHCPTSPGLHLMAAHRLGQAGKFEQAINEYRESIRLRPNEAGAYIELAGLLIKQNRLAEAREELLAALKAEPDNPGALAILTMDAISSGDDAAARHWLTRAQTQPRIPTEQMATLLDGYQRKFGRRFE